MEAGDKHNFYVSHRMLRVDIFSCRHDGKGRGYARADFYKLPTGSFSAIRNGILHDIYSYDNGLYNTFHAKESRSIDAKKGNMFTVMGKSFTALRRYFYCGAV